MKDNKNDRAVSSNDRDVDWRETERRSARFDGLENWPVTDVLSALLSGQQQGLNAVWGALGAIEQAVDAAVKRLRDPKGRLVYIGAGTSGRLAVLDGVELTPTFGWPHERIVYLFAGGDGGLRSAREGAEDDGVQARADIEAAKVGPHDVVIALAASGTTPYTRAGVELARQSGALTIGFANNPGSPLLDDAEIGVLLRTGSEVLAGSTRLAAGTSQKSALNMFSTALMIGLNKVHRGYMVDMQTKNEKLVLRAARIVSEITGCTLKEAERALATANNQIKQAVLLVNNVDLETAEQLLSRHDGNLGAALEDANGAGTK